MLTERKQTSQPDVNTGNPRAIQRALSMLALYFLIIAIPLGAYLVYTSNQEKYFSAWRFRQLNSIGTEIVARVNLIGQVLSYHDFSPAGDKQKSNWPHWLRDMEISAKPPVFSARPSKSPDKVISELPYYFDFIENVTNRYSDLIKQLNAPSKSDEKIRHLEKQIASIRENIDRIVKALNYHIDCFNIRTRTTKPLMALQLNAEYSATLNIDWPGCAAPENIQKVVNALKQISTKDKLGIDLEIAKSLDKIHLLDSRKIGNFLNKASTSHQAAMLKASDEAKSSPGKLGWDKDLVELANEKFAADPSLFDSWNISTRLDALVPEQYADNRKFDDIVIVTDQARIISRHTHIMGDRVPDWDIGDLKKSSSDKAPSEALGKNGLIALVENAPVMRDRRYDNKRLLKTQGGDYYLFCQPLQIQASGARNLSLCGLIEKNRFDEGVGEVTPRQVSLFLLVLLLSFSLLPFLKIALISREETFRKRDFAAVRLAMIAGGSVLTILVLDIIAYRYFALEIDSVSAQIAKKIVRSVDTEVSELQDTASTYASNFGTLNKLPFPRLPPSPKSSETKNYSCKPPLDYGTWGRDFSTFDSCEFAGGITQIGDIRVHPPVHYYSDGGDGTQNGEDSVEPPRYEVLIATNNQGQQLGPVVTSRKDAWLGVPADVGNRDYFKRAMGIGPAQPVDIQGQKYAIQRIRERSIGEKLTALAIQFDDYKHADKKQTDGPLAPGIIFVTRRLYALFKPVLPSGFGYAVLDNRSNQVLYHSEDDLSLVENMLEEVDPTYALNELGKRKDESRVIRYHGRDHRIFVTNIEKLDSRLVIIYDMQYPQAMAYQTVILALCLLATYILVLLLSGIVVQKLVGIVRGEVQLAVWLWPHYSLNKRYSLAALGQLSIGLGALLIFICRPDDNYTRGIFLLLPLIVMGGQALFLGFFSHRTFTGNRLVSSRGEPPPALKKMSLLACTAIYLINLGLIPSLLIFSSAQSVTINNLMYAWSLDMQGQEKSRQEVIRSDFLRINKHTYSDRSKAVEAPGNYRQALCEPELNAFDTQAENNPSEEIQYKFCVPNYPRAWAHSYTSLIPVWNSATEYLDRHYSLAPVREDSPSGKDSIDRKGKNYDDNGPWIFAYNPMFLPGIFANLDSLREKLFKPNAEEVAITPKNKNPYQTLMLISFATCIFIIGCIIMMFMPWAARKLLGTRLQTPLPLEEILPEQISLDRSTTLIRPRPDFVEEFISWASSRRKCIHINIGLDGNNNSETQPVWLNEAQLDFGEYFILEAFDSRLSDRGWLSAKLDLLESIQKRGKHVLILTDVALPYRITIYEGDNSEALLTRTDAQRWGAVLSHYTKLRYLPNAAVQSHPAIPLALARECYWDAALGDIVRKSWRSNTHLVEHLQELSCHFSGYDELSSRWVADIGRARFREIWALSTQREKLVLHRIASGALLNPANSDIVEHLIQRRLLIRWPDFQIASSSFRDFILEAESAQTFQAWEAQSKTGLWPSVQRPIAVLFVAILALLISTQSGASQALVAIITAFAGGLPLLTLIFGRVQAHGISNQ